jgi:VanZ family protein
VKPLFSRHERIAVLAIYAVTLAVTTHLPGVRVPSKFEYTDKIIHLSAFAGLTVLVSLALRPRRLWLAGLALMAYAGADEWTQQFFQRNTDVFDWIADSIGIWVALGLVWLVRRRQSSSSKSPDA